MKELVSLHNLYVHLSTKAPCGRSDMAQVELKKSVDELLDKIVSDNAVLFELLSTNGNGKKLHFLRRVLY